MIWLTAFPNQTWLRQSHPYFRLISGRCHFVLKLTYFTL